MIFDPVHVPRIEPPIIVPEFVKARHTVPLDPPGHIDIRVEVTPDELPQVSKQRLSSVQARVARPRDRSPKSIPLKHEDHMVQRVDRLEAEDERRVAMPLHRHRREERRFETVRASVADDAAEAAGDNRAARE